MLAMIQKLLRPELLWDLEVEGKKTVKRKRRFPGKFWDLCA